MDTKTTKGTVHNLKLFIAISITSLSKMENIILQFLYAMAQTTCVWRHYMPQEEKRLSVVEMIKVIEERVIFPHQKRCPLPQSNLWH